MILVSHISHQSVMSFYLSLFLQIQGLAMDMFDIIFLTEILFERKGTIAWSII